MIALTRNVLMIAQEMEYVNQMEYANVKVDSQEMTVQRNLVIWIVIITVNV
jgi:hypothetical protein